MKYLALDLGGTKTTGALFDETGTIVDDYIYVYRTKTEQGEEKVYDGVRHVLDHIIEYFNIPKSEISGIGVGGPGPLDTKTGTIINAPLMKWFDFPIVDNLVEDYGIPVALDNDGNLGALAEQRCGLGQGYENVMYMTISTGCGGGIIINNEIYHGKNDDACEVGHISIDVNGLLCPCGNRGCLELYASGTAMNRRMIEDFKLMKKSLVFDMADNDIANITGELLSDAAEQGDSYALDFYEKEALYLGAGIANLLNAFDPDTLILGGGVTKGKKYFHESMINVIKERCIQPINEDTIQYSKLNDRVILYGAYYLIKEKSEKEGKILCL